MLRNPRPLDEVVPLLDECLSGLVRGCALPARISCIGRSGLRKQSNQPLRVVQQKIGPLISRKPARKADRQHVFIEELGKIRVGRRIPLRAGARSALRTRSIRFLRALVAQLP